MQSNVNKNEFIRYDEGAKRYSMCKHTFMKLAQEAHAVYKINRLTLVNTRVFEEYLESFRPLINDFLRKMAKFRHQENQDVRPEQG